MIETITTIIMEFFAILAVAQLYDIAHAVGKTCESLEEINKTLKKIAGISDDEE